MEITINKNTAKIILISCLILLISNLSQICMSQDSTPPSLSDPMPQDCSVITGGENAFSIVVEDENLDTSTARLIIKASDETSWERKELNCYNTGENWLCNTTVSFRIVGSDTVEDYYFEANDTEGNYGNYSAPSNPLKLTIDRNPPIMEWISPNRTFYSESVHAILDIHDGGAGLDSSNTGVSLDNETWMELNDMGEDIFSRNIDINGIPSGENATIYVKVIDNIGNGNSSSINITVDNGAPFISIISPEEGEKLKSTINMQINATDEHSAVNASLITYEIDKLVGGMDCTSGDVVECEKIYNTAHADDGNYTVRFNASDLAGNKISEAVNVTIDNSVVDASITSHSDNDYINGIVTINVSINQPGSVENVKIKTSDIWEEMGCEEYDCSYVWDTRSIENGIYNIEVNATHDLDYDVGDSIQVTVDNTKPILYIDSPSGDTVSGVIYPKVIVTDEWGIDNESTTFSIASYSYPMLCSEYTQGKKYVCSNSFETSKLENGYYNLTFHTSDLAGNTNSTYKTLLIDSEYEGDGDNGGTSDTDTDTTTDTNDYINTSNDSDNDVNGINDDTASSESTGGDNSLTSIIVERISRPVVVLFGDDSMIGGIIKPWPLRAFAISMIIFLLLIALFKTSFVQNLLKPENTEFGS